MKKIFMFLLLCLIGIASASARPGGKAQMSVIVVGQISGSAKTVVNSAFMQRLSGNTRYAIFERNESILEGLTQEQDFELDGCVPESEIRSICKRKGVDYVTVVDVLILEGECHMTGRVVNVTTGQVLKSATEMRGYEGLGTLKALANRLAYKLYSAE